MNRNTIQNLASGLASSHKKTTYARTGSAFSKLMITKEQIKTLDRYYADIEDNVFENTTEESATEWLRDNYYMLKLFASDLKKQIKNVEKSIPVLSDGIMKGFPRVYALALAYVDFNAGVISEEGVKEFVTLYQQEQILEANELWALSCVFSLALLKNVMTLICRHYETMNEKKRIKSVAERLIATGNVSTSSLYDVCNVNNAVSLATFIMTLQGRNDSGEVLPWLDTELSKLNVNVNDIIEFANRIESNCTVTIRNSITSLMKIGTFDWEGIFSATSFADRIMAQDPTGVYPKMDIKSKNIYRKELSRYARRHKQSECSAAENIISEATSEGKHFGFLLFENKTEKTRLKKALYSVSLCLAVLVYYVFLLNVLGILGMNAFLFIPVALVTFIPAKNAATQVLNYFATKLVKPFEFVRMDYENGLPPDRRTLAVVPALLADERSVDILAGTMEKNYLANRDKNLKFVLLGDYADSDCPKMLEDEKIRSAAERAVRDLNKKYGARIFYYLQRERKLNRKQKRYFGWERKRGAVIQLNRFIVSGDPSDFSFSSEGIVDIVGAEYVITLDSDTVMPPGSAARLVATADHPLNVPVFDEKTGTVVSGYGIFQPRMETDLESGSKTRFSHITSGYVGSEPYQSGVSEIFQDVFDSGNFGGKGIYKPEIFLKAIDGRFPENAILSHDMAEGCFLRCGYVSDITFVDETPSSYASFRKRQHRWNRGDWQLLPFILPSVKNEKGEKTENVLSFVSKYKITENLLRTLFEPCLCVLLFAGIFSKAALAAFLLIVWNYHFFSIRIELFEFFRYRLFQNEYKRIEAFSFLRPLTELVLLADTAVNSLDATVRTLSRLKSGRKLLEWQTAMQAEKQSRNSNAYYVGMMKISVAVGGIIVALSVLMLNFVSFAFGAAFMLAPALMKRASQEKKKKKLRLSAEEEETVILCARGAWKYFLELCNGENNYLPPDNYQEEPYKGAANRTSPTNIGMMLAGSVAAEKMGFADRNEVVCLTNKTLNTLYRLEKWNGHPYNWYDTVNLKPLCPFFVSSADNGNLACSLLVLKAALEEYKRSSENEAANEELLLTLNDSLSLINKLLSDMDFSLLYDERKELLAVGYNTAENRLSEYAYDLMASEARLASFYAVISGNVPIKHWGRLSRKAVRLNGNYAVKSWSGSMFEYLMPALMLKTYDGSLMSAAFSSVIKEQMRYGEKAGLPWGISEAGYWLFDEEKNYLYKAFGIPCEAVSYVRGNEFVVSPYSSALALAVSPEMSAKNLVRLKNMGLCCTYGFYESADFSGNEVNIVRSYMAHHEGMSLIAAANCLCDNCIVNLFHSSAEVRAGELFLKEKIPQTVPFDALPKKVIHRQPLINAERECTHHFNFLRNYPTITVMTNGTSSFLISDTGSNFMKCNGKLVNKWKSNEIAEDSGHFIFIKDQASQRSISVTPAPLFNGKNECEVVFRPEAVTFRKRHKNIETSLKITLSADKNATVYRLKIRNNSKRTRLLTVSDFLLPALEREVASLQHPQYSDMFVECFFNRETNAAVARRTPHTEGEKPSFAAVVVAGENVTARPILSGLDFIGRDNSLSEADFLKPDFDRKGVKNGTMMPLLSLSADITLAEGNTAELCFTVCCAEEYDELIKLTEFFSKPENCRQTFELAFEHSKLYTKYRGIDRKKYVIMNGLLSRLIYPQAYRRSVSSLRKETLWQFGISGDIPFVCFESDVRNTSGLKLLLETADCLYSADIRFDIIIITVDDGYHKDNYDNAVSTVAVSPLREYVKKKDGGVFIISGENRINEIKSIESASAALLSGNEMQIVSGLETDGKPIKRESFELLKRLRRSYKDMPLEAKKLVFFNGYGGFSDDFGSYTVLLSDGASTPRPWSTVLANRSFGTLITERGGGYTWFGNSRENKLSSWSNDPVSDGVSEAIFVRDDSTMQYTSPTRLKKSGGEYRITFYCGKAEFEHNGTGLELKETVFVPHGDNVKVVMLDVTNSEDSQRKLSVIYYTECLLSPDTSVIKDDIQTFSEKTNGIVLAENRMRKENGIMFIGCNRQITGVLTNKTDFIGRTGKLSEPVALNYASWNQGRQKRRADCIAIQINAEIKAHCRQTIVFVVGCGKTKNEIYALKNKYARPDKINTILKAETDYITALTHPFRITTNDKSLDALFNSFLMYQTLVCRYYAKTSFYQCSGAFGFRDQLQDATAFVYADENEARKHILCAAGQQYQDGSVRHWWHGDSGNGVRNGISDDRLFLPYAASEYARITGDHSIFREEIPYLAGGKLKDKSEFGKAEQSDACETLYGHCIRAIKSVEFGEHGLPLIGTGDWNDGFNKVGEKGKGESVWLAFFLRDVLSRMSMLPDAEKDIESIREMQIRLDESISSGAWADDRFIRAYYDDGTPLGTEESDECKIDIIAQSWAAISGAENKEKVSKALDTAYKYLVDEENGIIKLFTPPFENSKHDPGYIKAYKSGIRENGGQYTHGAIWFAIANMIMGKKERAYKLVKMLNPINHSLTKDEADRYKVEPYVVAADIYTNKKDYGMGGWTWYTGSAGWMYKAILEYFLGIKKEGDTLKVCPEVTDEMLPFRVEYDHRKNGTVTHYMIDVIGRDNITELDGVLLADGVIPLASDGKSHKATVR